MRAPAMSSPASNLGYARTARVLHWVTAIIVIGIVPAGIYMANASPGPTQDLLFNLHRSFGVLLLPIVLVRLAYRVGHAPPPLPPDIAPLQRTAAQAVHWALYALLIVQPIVGWIATSAYRAPIRVFWLFELPPIWPVDRPFSEQMFFVHRVLGFAIAILALIHIGAALYHHFVRRDAVLMRMLRG